MESREHYVPEARCSKRSSALAINERMDVVCLSQQLRVNQRVVLWIGALQSDRADAPWVQQQRRYVHAAFRLVGTIVQRLPDLHTHIHNGLADKCHVNLYVRQLVSEDFMKD